MSEDFFKANGSVGGVFKGTLVKMVLAGIEAAQGSLVQQVGVSYSRQVNRIWELGSEDTYYILGHTQGNATLNKIVGKTDTDVLANMQDACQAITQTLVLSDTGGGVGGQCLGDNLGFKLTMKGPVLETVGFSINANNFLITQDASIQFASLAKD